MKNRDILQELDFSLSREIETKTEEIENTKTDSTINFHYEVSVIQKHKKSKFIGISMFFMKYTLTCTLIFGVLLVGTNYSAYFNIAKSYIFHEEMKEKRQSIMNSVEASSLKIKEETNIEEKTIRNISNKKEDLSIHKYKKELNTQDIQLGIEITPYENRLVIPKIGKNVPLLNIKNRTIESENQLENIFMEELENGVVRYPGSAIPGEKGNAFIFGHSSNSPWVDGDYNDVFATLNNLVQEDEIIVYYEQKKYVYKVKEKKVITPGDVSILKRDNNKSEITIMTCWPIGTDYNRLIVIGELVTE